jgi:hypothetical protein
VVLDLRLDNPRRDAECFGNYDSVQGRSYDKLTAHNAIKAMLQAAARVENARDQAKGAMSAQVLHVWHDGQLVPFMP